MIENHAGLEQARRHLQGMEEAVAELMQQADAMHPSQLLVLLEGPMEIVRRLRAEIDEYLGIERAAALLKDQCAESAQR